MSDSYWFYKKWGIDEVSNNSLIDKLLYLEKRIEKLEEENIETTNTLYELMNSIEAVDRRIDIVAESI